jgi:hypothetical protein
LHGLDSSQSAPSDAKASGDKAIEFVETLTFSQGHRQMDLKPNPPVRRSIQLDGATLRKYAADPSIEKPLLAFQTCIWNSLNELDLWLFHRFLFLLAISHNLNRVVVDRGPY